MAAAKVIVVVIAGVVFVIVILDVGVRFFRALTAKTCILSKHILIPDKCLGPCPGTGLKCTGTIKRPYFGGVLGVQDAFCNCIPTAAAAGTGGGTGGGGTGGSGGGSGGDGE